MTFDEIEDCFPEGSNAAIDEDGNETGFVFVSAQWLHDFAKNIENATLREALRAHGEEAAKVNAEPFEWICPRCKVDRTKQPCPGGTGNCPMIGTAYAAAPKPE